MIVTPTHMTEAGRQAIIAAGRAVIERNNQLRAQRELRAFLQRQGEPVRDVPAYRVPTLLKVCK